MTDSAHALFVVALPGEARPLVEHYVLKRDMSDSPFPIFRGDNMTLVVSGIGKVKAAAATSYALSMRGPFSNLSIINIGIAGAARECGAKIGDLFVINKIVDNGSGREFFPDMLLAAGIEETTVTTFDHAVTLSTPRVPLDGLVDMEASGFQEAASIFLPPHNIACIKIVSDHLDGSPMKKRTVEQLVAGHLTEIEKYVTAMSNLAGNDGTLDRETCEWIDHVSRFLRLTFSQKNLLQGWTSDYLHYKGVPLPDIEMTRGEPVKTKQEGKRRLAEIRKILSIA